MAPNPIPEPLAVQPAHIKRILCLANSRKLSGRCVAGREIFNGQPGEWIRPVSDREHQEVSWQERHYENGSDPLVLDVIDIPLVEHRPHTFQQENWLLDSRFYWSKKGRMNWAEMQNFVNPPGLLWINGQSSYSGTNNRVSLAEANQFTCSLQLIRVQNLEIEILQPGAAFGDRKRRVQAQFQYGGAFYQLRVTDRAYETRYLAKQDGNYQIGEACLTISLGEPFEGNAYKLVAAIIERAEVENQ